MKWIPGRQANAFSDGSPASACASLYPAHGDFASQISPPPYNVLVGQERYNSGDVINGQYIHVAFLSLITKY